MAVLTQYKDKDGSHVRIRALDNGYLREVVDPETDAVLAARPISKKQAQSEVRTLPVARPRTVVTTKWALLQLLTERPGQTVSYADVCERLGREVSRQAVSGAAAYLAGKGLKVTAGRGRGGGYVLEVTE